MHLRTDTARAESHFAAVPTISKPRSGFTVAKKHVTTIQFDYLYPTYWNYMGPGETLNITHTLLARLTTQKAVLYDDLYFDVHAWSVPKRLLHEPDQFARYMYNSQPLGPSQDNSSLTSPKITLTSLTTGFPAKSLYDTLGFPTDADLSGNTEHINNYIARAYNLTWNTNYRDQNLQTAVTVDLDFGPDDPDDYVLLKRGKRHDKFTSMLIAQQKGDPVTMNFGTTAPVNLTAQGTRQIVRPWNNHAGVTGADTLDVAATTGYLTTIAVNSVIDPNGTYVSDISGLTLTVNEIRTSAAIQHLLEMDARGGTRDVEAIQNHFGVTVPDFRLQRPEYLGGTTFAFDGHIIPQTSETGTTPQANLVQFSQVKSSLHVTHSFQEHSVMFILVSARSNMTYQQQLTRELSYRTRLDWVWPVFNNLGEVAVKAKELNMIGGDGVADNVTLGFQEYGYEKRFSDNMVTNEMRSSFAQSRDIKHMAYDISGTPSYNSAFIESDTPITRNIVTAAETADPIELSILTSGLCVRTLSMYSIPGLDKL